MPAVRKTATIHRLQGTYRPDRHRDPMAVAPMDTTPPPHLNDAEVAAWHELAAAAEPFLARSDRFAVELAARMVVRVRGADAKAADIAQLVGLHRKLGLTPDGRRQLDPVKPPAEPNAFDDI